MPLLPFATSPIIILTVGPTKTPFHIHGQLLRTYSGFFSITLDTDTAHGLTRTIHCPADSVTSIERFVHWLYARAVGSDNDVSTSFASPERLVDLYAFADRKDVPEFKKDIFKKLKGAIRYTLRAGGLPVSIEAVGVVYEKLGDEEDGLRRLFVEGFIEAEKRGHFGFEDEEVMGELEKVPGSLADLMDAVEEERTRVRRRRERAHREHGYRY